MVRGAESGLSDIDADAIGWSFHGPPFPSYDEVMAQHNRAVARHPRTVFISAHLARRAASRAGC